VGSIGRIFSCVVFHQVFEVEGTQGGDYRDYWEIPLSLFVDHDWTTRGGHPALAEQLQLDFGFIAIVTDVNNSQRWPGLSVIDLGGRWES